MHSTCRSALRARAIINGPSHRAVDFVAGRDRRTMGLPAAQTRGLPTKSCHKSPSESGPFIIARALGPVVSLIFRFLFSVSFGFSSIVIGNFGFSENANAVTNEALDCSRAPGSLPDPNLPPGQVNSAVPIDHIIVLMQENHSFDNYFGRLNQPEYYGAEVDGVLNSMTNLDKAGNPVAAYKETNLCPKDPWHSWNQIHLDWNNGKNDGFVKQNDKWVMGYYDQSDLGYYYALANQFAIADRYFSSVLTSTFPNRYFLMAGTAFGHIKNDFPKTKDDFSQKTIFDVLTEQKISWKYYTDDKGYLTLFNPMYKRNLDKMAKIAEYHSDLENGKLPQVVFVDASFDGQDEHPAGNIQYGQSFSARIVNSLIASSSWKSSALFLTYDEGGGFYDHVPPPEACLPDEIAPVLSPKSVKGTYDRYGFRVPFIVISPFAKHHYVSHTIYDHTSILKFIETKFNLPALSLRDANANNMMDLFDFNNPVFEVKALPLAIETANACEQPITRAQ
jgi:phospholipase C